MTGSRSSGSLRSRPAGSLGAWPLTRPRAFQHVAWVLLSLVSIVLSGYKDYTSKHVVQIPLIHSLNEPALFSGDPLIDTFPYYASPFWSGVALLTRVAPLEAVFFVGFVLQRFLLIFAAGHLARALAPASVLAPIGSMAFLALAPRPLIATGTIMPVFFEQTGFAMACYLLAAAEVVRGRPLVWAVLMAAGFYANSLYGVHAMSFLGASVLLDPACRRQWRRWLFGAASFVLLAAPVLALSLGTFSKEAEDPERWMSIAEIRLSHHLMPASWPAEGYARLALLGAAAAGVLLLARREGSRLHRLYPVWTAVMAGWLGLAFVAAYGLREPSLLVLQAGRASDYFVCLASITLVTTCARCAESGSARAGLWLAGLLVFLASWLTWPVAPLVGLGVVLVPALWIAWEDRFRAAAGAWLILLVITGQGLAEGVGRAVGAGSASASVLLPRDPAIPAVASWARSHTPPASRFLINPGWAMFRALAQRPVFIAWDDATAMLYDRSFVDVWVGRMRELGVELPGDHRDVFDLRQRVAPAYRRLSDCDVLRLREEFGLDYWILGADHPTDLPVVYEGHRLKVARLPDAAGGAGRNCL